MAFARPRTTFPAPCAARNPWMVTPGDGLRWQTPKDVETELHAPAQEEPGDGKDDHHNDDDPHDPETTGCEHGISLPRVPGIRSRPAS